MWKAMTAIAVRYARLVRPAPVVEVPAAPVVAKRHPSHISGRYGALYTHLENRYADMVVLTFGQIEDLLGFPLPELARTRDWWTVVNGSANGSPQSEAWIQAGRTAVPNLTTRTVAFERGIGL